MINRIFVALVLAVSTALLALAHTVDDQAQQGGDQFLDGIGETGLIARYILSGNAEDASRNQLHANAARNRRNLRRGRSAPRAAADRRRQLPAAPGATLIR